MVRCAATTLKNRRCKAHAMIDQSFCRVHREDELCSVIEDPEQIVKDLVKGVFDNVIAKNEIPNPFNLNFCEYCNRFAVWQCGFIKACPDHRI